MAAVGIVTVSLTLAGALTWTLVSRLELNSAQDQLAKNALLLKPTIGKLDCLGFNVQGQCTARVASEAAFVDNVRASPDLNLAGDRLVLLDRPHAIRGVPVRQYTVIYDSESLLLPGVPVPLGKETRVSGQTVRAGTTMFGGQEYLVTAVQLANKYSAWMVLGRPYDAVASSATRQLVPPILLSGSAGLLLAIVATLLLSRAFTHPLHDLRKAAEDIAAGNYSRRVAATGGDEVGVVGQAFNRMAEAVERARSQQRAFLANVSHELKTPLTSLIGFSQALMDGSLRTDQEKLRAATILNEEAQRVLRMSQELLDLARVESGQITLNPNPVDLGGQLEQEIEIVRSRAQARRLALQLAVPSTLPPVRADPDRLHQILENLLDNAVKYAPEGTEVLISAEAGLNGSVTALVRNQVGSPAPDPERMFDRFYRGDPSRSSSAGGVGLGLAISRELAIAQEGSLKAELGPDGSLCMKLGLPAVSHPAAPTDPAVRMPLRLNPRHS